jgi:group I intron endonuclease
MFYVYKITNKVNGKVYIGKTNNIDRRYHAHMTIPFSNSKAANSLVKFYRSVRKYGVSNFSEPEILGTYEDEMIAYQQELQFIANFANFDSWKHGLNSTEGGTGGGHGESNPFYGKTHTTETKQIMSQKKKEYLTTHPNNFFGKHHSDESLKLMSESHIGMHAGIKNPMYGKPRTAKVKAAISKSRAEKFEFYSELNRGSKNPLAKLNEEKVYTIKQLIAEGKTNAEIAKLFKVSRRLISGIRSGTYWVHVNYQTTVNPVENPGTIHPEILGSPIVKPEVPPL